LIVASSGGTPTPIEVRKEERELFFWTIDKALLALRQALGLIVLASLAAYLIVSLAEGRLPQELLRYQEPWQLPPGT
jgi:hypothetical protein